MDKKKAGKKMQLSRETLRQLTADRLETIAAGATNVRTICFSCDSVCATNCHGC
jgi:predicted DNA-binding protein (UPF0251 family)